MKLADGDFVSLHDALGHEVDDERNNKKEQTDHEKRTPFDAAVFRLAKFLGYDTRHGMDGLENDHQTIAHGRDGDAVARAEQNDHGLADDPAKAEQHGRDDSGQRG